MIKDADGNILHDGDRVFGYDVKDNEYQKIYGTLCISDHHLTFGQWCVDYDDGESFIVLDFKAIWKA